jgi:ketosteroid isomerase-like protein
VSTRSTTEAVARLLYTYAERIDDGDFAGVAELFAHATLTFAGRDDVVSGEAAVRTLYERTTRRYEDGTPRTKHVMTNVLVDEAGDTAHSRSSFTVLQALPGALALQPIIAGRYHNSYERVDGQWRFHSVHIIIDLVGELGHHLLIDPLA